VLGAPLAGPGAAITSRTMMSRLQTFAVVRNRAFASALIARSLTMFIVTSATPLRNFFDRPGRRKAAGGHLLRRLLGILAFTQYSRGLNTLRCYLKAKNKKCCM